MRSIKFKFFSTLMLIGILGLGTIQARVYLCEGEEFDPFAEPCERIDYVKINGELVEANCENIMVPPGWHINCCCD